MTKLEYHQFPYLSDNYGVLVHSPETGETAAIDAGEAQPYLDALAQKGWKLTELWITHHHWDHTDGLMEIKEKTGCKVRGPRNQSAMIKGLDEKHADGENFMFAGMEVDVIETPGHTTDMINYYLTAEGVAFVGDTLFTLGCGRVFEGTKPMMWESLCKLRKLPPETIIYSSHEYTLANAEFALSVDPQNSLLEKRAEEIRVLRENGRPTVPTTLRVELSTNPFLRADDPKIRAHLGMENASDAEVFTELRTRKDNS